MLDPEFVERLKLIRDKTLVCFCKPKDGFQGKLLCHGQLLAIAADGELDYYLTALDIDKDIITALELAMAKHRNDAT